MKEQHRIAEIHIAPVETTFGRVVGRNSKSDNYGLNQREWLVQVMTDSGLRGVTNARPAMNRGSLAQLCDSLSQLLGRDVFEFHRTSGERVLGVHPRWETYLADHGFVSFVLFDLMGRALGVPAHKLLSDQVRDRVGAYDSSLYFQDLIHPGEGAGAVAREAAEAVQKGWRAVKLKIGRPGKWFEPHAGVARDIEVVHRVREAVGPEVRILVDANNGYDPHPDLLHEFVKEIADAEVFWMEEMITENVAGYRQLREWRDRYTPGTMLVDGEGHRGRNTIYWQLMEEELLDAIQPDMLDMGFWPFHKLATDIAESGLKAKIAPHNFNAAFVGLRGDVQFGAVTEQFVIAEDSTLDFDLYHAPGYVFEGGSYAVPDTPGLAVEIDQELYERRHLATETVLTV